MRRFNLVRNIDSTGISGTGTVAEGVEFSDGRVVTRWIISEIKQTCIWDSIQHVEAIHGHNGDTIIIWLD